MIRLARAELDMAHALRLGLRDAYDWHKAAWRCFPDEPEARRDFLTRLDPPQAGSRRCRFWLLSARCPQRPDWCPPEGWGVKAVAPGFLEHERYCFDLLANPAASGSLWTRTASAEKTAAAKRSQAGKNNWTGCGAKPRNTAFTLWKRRRAHLSRSTPLKLTTSARPELTG